MKQDISKLSNEDLNELLTILNVALGDADVAINLSHDTQELDAYKQHKQMIRKWIRHFSRLIKDTRQSSESEATLHNLEKPWLPIQPGEEF